MWEEMARRIVAAGGEIRLGSPVEAFEVDGGRVAAVRAGGVETEVSAVISSAPLPAVVELAGTFEDPDELANHLGFLQLDLGEPEFHALALRWWEAAACEVRALLDEAVERGDLVPRTDTRRLARTVLALYSGATVTWGMWREGPLDRWLGRELDALFSGARRSAAGTGTG